VFTLETGPAQAQIFVSEDDDFAAAFEKRMRQRMDLFCCFAAHFAAWLKPG
jgi:hypothetical protein